MKLSFNLPASGKLDVSGSVDATGTCPAGPNCSFETGLYLDGVPIPGTGFSNDVPPMGPIACGGASPFFFGGAGLTTRVPAGSHELSIGYSQTGGDADLDFECEPYLQAIGPYQ